MKGLVSKKIERLLDLITCFEIHDGQLDMDTASRELNRPITALLMDVMQANTFFSSILEIRRENNLEIIYKDGMSYPDAFSLVMKQDPICSLLEKVFFHPQMDVNAMANDLYVSNSTIYRWVEQFNAVVADSYAVHLETHPLVLLGDEAEVRSFYTSFFKERYSFYEWPFSFISKQELSLFLDDALPMKYAKNFLNYYECFHIQLAVSLQRFSQGFRLADEHLAHNARALATAEAFASKEAHYPFPSFPIERQGNDRRRDDVRENGRRENDRWESDHQANGRRANGCRESDRRESDRRDNDRRASDRWESDVRFYQELLVPFVGDRDAESFTVLLDLTAKDPLVNTIFIYINKLIANVCQEFPIELDNESDLTLALYNALIGTFGKTVSRSILYSPYRIYQESIRTKFPAVCNQILDIIRSQNALFNFPIDADYVGYLFYVIWSTWENLSNQLIQKPRKIKILVVSRFSYFHTLSLRSQILFYFGNLVEVSVPKIAPIFLETMDLSDYDLLVSNFNIAGSPIPTIFCNGIDSYATYSALAKAIFERF